MNLDSTQSLNVETEVCKYWTNIHTSFPKRNAQIRGKEDQMREKEEFLFNLFFNFLLPWTVKY